MTGERAAELAANLAAVNERIVAACRTAGRDPGEVTLTVVTKFFPASDVELLAGLGVTDVGENRHQEAEQKVADCRATGLRWHYIGGLQSNKAAAVAAYADVVESVDRAKLVGGLARGAATRGRVLDVLLQVSLDPPGEAQGRAGVTEADLGPLADQVAASDDLNLCGLMAVAPLGADPESSFAELAGIAERFRHQHPEATLLSAGMSGDLEAAILHGATHVRIGRAVLGERPKIK
ncbi:MULTISPECIES: YggS family pyridoxal phosphate-dependent enzyme [unclassified Nocardioides]|uniref:YggS family pyridoxal phosphate-dependent enzyme n=1 Tax=unclassified Nocardioides TaxID=2615069 RepID=UPI0006F41562|nr:MULTISPECIES: YggS family pyridoxal phosphate-dependent enzyme [unclassified Nocardioides]KQY63992.1 alanine racemase [Nocardioides sp. Root140]KQZ69912.1 alanine racemase [Nocardioides sp. Root151]KRF16005.1 alanine racemase [Nocardioides sp. Soil796]